VIQELKSRPGQPLPAPAARGRKGRGLRAEPFRRFQRTFHAGSAFTIIRGKLGAGRHGLAPLDLACKGASSGGPLEPLRIVPAVRRGKIKSVEHGFFEQQESLGSMVSCSCHVRHMYANALQQARDFRLRGTKVFPCRRRGPITTKVRPGGASENGGNNGRKKMAIPRYRPPPGAG